MEHLRFFKTFDEFIFEGGNARVIDRKTGKILARAEKIDLKKFSRTEIVNSITETLKQLNLMYQKRFSKLIWKSDDVISKSFSGSSEFFMDLSISDAEFVSSKQTVGDVDVIVPKEVKENFENLMTSLEGSKLTKLITYLGQDRADFGTTWLGVFKYSKNGQSVNIQIDFEYGDWTEEGPSEWSKFSHNSNWEDIKNNIKGVHHKLLLINLARALSKRNDIVIATPTSTPEKIKLVTGKKGDQTPRLLAFSVDKGLRIKCKQMEDASGNPIKANGKLIFQEIPIASSDYTKNIKEIYSYIFGKEPSAEDLKDFSSFSGLVKLIKKKLSKDDIEELFNFLLAENLFGKKAQIIEKSDRDLDRKVKQTMVDKLFESFPFLKSKSGEVERMADEYYESKWSADWKFNDDDQ